MAAPGFWDKPADAKSKVQRLKALRARVGEAAAIEKEIREQQELLEMAVSLGDEAETEAVGKKAEEISSRLDRLEMQVLDAQIAQAEAQTALAADRLERTRIAAGIGGLVVSGDLSQMLGAPVEQGKILFEVAPLDSYRVVLQVDEEDMRYVEVGQRGSLALTGAAGESAPFRVTRLTSVAAAEEASLKGQGGERRRPAPIVNDW